MWQTVGLSPVWGDPGSHQPLAQLPDLSPLPGALSRPRLPRSFENSSPAGKAHPLSLVVSWGFSLPLNT